MVPFFLYATCSITYEGRASSTLEEGNYVILWKPDGSLLIHGASSVKPLNFQSAGTVIEEYAGRRIVARRKKEIITIDIAQIHQFFEIRNWSDNRIVIRKTEDDLRNYIISNINEIVSDEIFDVQKEFQVEYGAIDILARGNKTHIIEVKRGKASLTACTQLERYLSCFEKEMYVTEVVGWIMSPQISANALKYLQSHHLRWRKVEHLE